MRRAVLLLFAFIISTQSFAQHTIRMRTLWTPPQVHVLFSGYTISFTIKDINKALTLLAQTGDTTYGRSSGLDTAADYSIELYPGTGMQYRNRLGPLIQNGVGAFLISSGHAFIQNKKHKPVKAVLMDIQTLERGVDDAYILFYDPKNNNMLFSGKMAANMYHKDLGIN